MEEWRDIKGYEGKYQVSNLGRVRSLRDNFNRPREKILSLQDDRQGYKYVNLYKNSKPHTIKVHRLVAIHFIENPDNKPCVNHKDENKANNRVENLEWCTVAYNNCYGNRLKKVSKANKIANKGKKHSKETKEKIRQSSIGRGTKKIICITTGEVFNSMVEASRKYNVQTAHLTNCCKGRRNTTGKHPVTKTPLKWEYFKEEN